MAVRSNSSYLPLPRGLVNVWLTARNWVLLLRFSIADHTKYVGKSIGHKVSGANSHVRYVGLSANRLIVRGLQNDVKFSEDGERVIEGEDVD